MSKIIRIIMVIVGIGFIIFVHELGHFSAAKYYKVGVDEFAVGFGKKICSFNYNETEYRLNIFSWGGYVKLSTPNTEGFCDDFTKKSAFVRFIILIAGVFFNLLLAIAIFTYLGIREGISICKAFVLSFLNCCYISTEVIKTLGRLIIGKAKLEKTVCGPLYMTMVMANFAKDGVREYLYKLAEFSSMIMVFNLLPISFFDGGRIAYFMVEMIKGTPVDPYIINKIDWVFYYVLILFFIYVVFFDFKKILKNEKSIDKKFK